MINEYIVFAITFINEGCWPRKALFALKHMKHRYSKISAQVQRIEILDTWRREMGASRQIKHEEVTSIVNIEAML